MKLWMKRKKPNHVTLRLLLPALALLSGQSMTAQAAPPGYEMVVYENTWLGRRVIAGDYQEAIVKAVERLDERAESFDTLNTLCVAYTITGAFDRAMETCDAALRVGSGYVGSAATDPHHRMSHSRNLAVRNRWAMAHSNRGVLRAMTGDAEGAMRDFEKAIALESRVEAADGNLARLRATSTEPFAMTTANP